MAYFGPAASVLIGRLLIATAGRFARKNQVQQPIERLERAIKVPCPAIVHL